MQKTVNLYRHSAAFIFSLADVMSLLVRDGDGLVVEIAIAFADKIK